MAIIANPNNPTGKYITKSQLDDFVSQIPNDVVLVIDEAYIEYVKKEDYPNSLVYALSRPRTLVLRTFSKVYGLAGLRLGYAVGDPDVINILCRIRDPFNVNSVVQEAAIAALDDHAHVTKTIEHNLRLKPILSSGLRDLNFEVIDGAGNFLLVKRDAHMPSVADLCSKLFSLGIIVRSLDDYGLTDFLRISVGADWEVKQLFEGLKVVLT